MIVQRNIAPLPTIDTVMFNGCQKDFSLSLSSLGFFSQHLEGGSSHCLHGRPTCLGKDAGKDEISGSKIFNSAQESGCLG